MELGSRVEWILARREALCKNISHYLLICKTVLAVTVILAVMKLIRGSIIAATVTGMPRSGSGQGNAILVHHM